MAALAVETGNSEREAIYGECTAVANYANVASYARTSNETTTTVVPTPLCPNCGLNKKSGKGNCCVRGGSWFQNCGDEGDKNFDGLMWPLVAPTAAALSMDTDSEGYTWALVDTGSGTTAAPWEFGYHVDTAWGDMRTLRGGAGGQLKILRQDKLPGEVQ